MSIKIKINWSFEDTEFENFQYEEARKGAGLPSTLNLDLDEDEDDIVEYLHENYGFEVESWDYVD